MEIYLGQKVVYQTDGEGMYVGTSVADPDPMNEGHWLIPAGCVEMKPPTITGGKLPKWVGYKWKLINP
ncbi:hypothetical protein [Pseudomonas sp. GL-B-16]|uniref:hypothetical protein n=1 Tax=Pseudomonas sp. GL-B-16 TaxID=2832373 RepID=UPI001CBEFC46|nr:hypothetical protein [Pseudomonas sp. GL-B-16]